MFAAVSRCGSSVAGVVVLVRHFIESLMIFIAGLVRVFTFAGLGH